MSRLTEVVAYMEHTRENGGIIRGKLYSCTGFIHKCRMEIHKIFPHATESFIESETIAKASCEIASKLGPLEDFEEEFQVDLETKLKVEAHYMRNYRDSRQYVYCMALNGTIAKALIDRLYPTALHVLDLGPENTSFELPYSEYGKTWALTKEELE